jgi:hypothetical protein
MPARIATTASALRPTAHVLRTAQPMSSPSNDRTLLCRKPNTASQKSAQVADHVDPIGSLSTTVTETCANHVCIPSIARSMACGELYDRRVGR